MGFDCLFWLHQWGIPRHTCRFDLLLAGAVGKRQGISIPYPSPTPLLTPLGDPLRRDIIAAAGLGQYRIPVSGAGRSSPLRRIDWVLCVRAWTVRVSVGLVWLVSLVFHYWVEKRRC